MKNQTIKQLQNYFVIRILCRSTSAVLKRDKGSSNNNDNLGTSKYEAFEWMKNIDPKMIELIENEVGLAFIIYFIYVLLEKAINIGSKSKISDNVMKIIKVKKYIYIMNVKICYQNRGQNYISIFHI